MPYDAQDARVELLETLGQAGDALAEALAALGAAYEALDEQSGDRLEAALFAPVQTAYGRARRTHTAFAGRHGLAERDWPAGSPGLPSLGARGFLERALDAVADADGILAELQDSMAPVEVGDPELRAGLAEVRALVAGVQTSGEAFLRTLGR